MNAPIAAFLSLSPLALAVPDNGGFTNCDFEQGITGWGVWYSDDRNAVMTRYPYSADASVARSGRQSLKIVAPDENGCAFVMRTSPSMKPGIRYEVDYWFCATDDLDERAFCLKFNFRPAEKTMPAWKMKSIELLRTRRKTDGKWRYHAGSIRVPKDAGPSATLGLYLKGARGTIWIDDIRVRETQAAEDAIADLRVYDPYRVELGGAPLKKFTALKADGDPTLARAARYNEILVTSAFIKEDVRRCLRIRESCPGAEQLAARMDRAEDDLSKLYRAYGEAFHNSKSPDAAGAFARQAEALDAELNALQDDARKAIAAATERCRAAGRRWAPPPPPPAAGPPAISGDGRVNRLIFANRSIPAFQDLEKPLRFDPVHSTTVGNPRSEAPGCYDWSDYEKQWKDISAGGTARKSCLLLFMTLHDGSWAPKWLLDRATSDPEILHVTQPPAKLSDRKTCRQLNWWHPSVRDYAREIVGDMGRVFRPREEFLFYEFQWESYGPFVSTETGQREVGYGPRAEADFHRWLERKYGDIGRLNGRWGAAYASFADVRPPPDRFVIERRRSDPLAAEWEAWRESSYEDWCRLIYRTWKAADPAKPVLADNSNLLRSFNMPNLADTCDMMGFHNSGRTFMPTLMLLNGISRHNGFKPLAQYENFWGTQEDHDRMHEEPARRHGTQKHIFRMTVWNMLLQVWWYSYTAAEYLTNYDGNYFDPSYALTTLRYRTAALPVYFEKFRRLQGSLLDSRIVAPRLALLVPTTSMRNNFPPGASQTEIYDIFWELFPRNHHADPVHEEYFLDGRARLDDFDALILPHAAYLDARLQDAIIAWLNSGPRLLIAAGPPGIYDELGLDSGKLVRAALPGAPLKLLLDGKNSWEWISGKAPPGGMIESRVGPSKVVSLLKPFARLKSVPGLVDRLVAHVEKAAARPARDDRNAFELVLREQGGTRYLCALNPDQDAAAESLIRVKGAFDSVTDLDYEEGFPLTTRMEAGETVFPLRLEPGEATILRLTP